MEPNSIMIYVLLALVSLIILLFLIIAWPKSGKMGIHLKGVICPKCKEKAPLVRVPKHLKQMLWGGWTCANCGCEMDKYGNPIDS